ncbi:MAG TPA: cysteine hydrolase family protein [Anaerolineales bacterium]|nr:cysteine hydrolase family protein [Anaerolineales bacterium]
MKTALLVIDIQNDYFPGGKFSLVNPEDAAKKAYELLQCFREHNGHHVHIQHISLDSDASFFIKGDSGSDIHDSVAHFEGEPIVYKHKPNSFLNTDLLDILKSWEVERVVICGMMTHMCVDAATRAASDLGFDVLLAEDACATRDLQYDDTTIPADLVHKSFLAALKSYGRVMKTEEIISLLASEMV